MSAAVNRWVARLTSAIDRGQELEELNAGFASLDAPARVVKAFDILPGAHVLSSSFGAQAAVMLHLVRACARRSRSLCLTLATCSRRWTDSSTS